MATPAERAGLLSLYRHLLRTHAAALPPPLRGLGDTTVRSEWRSMVAASRREEPAARPDAAAWAAFAREWARYADALTATPGGGGGGRAGGPVSGDLKPEEIEALNEDQRATLRRMAAAAGDLLSKR